MSYSAAVLADSPTLYYQLQDSAADTSGNGSPNITITGATYATGIVDASPRALDFDGVNDYAEKSVAWGSNKLSITFWANFDAFSFTQVWLESSANYSLSLNATTDGRVLVYSDGSVLQVAMIGNDGAGSAHVYDTGTVPLPSTNDTHFAFVFDRSASTTGRMKVYYNGTLQTISSASWQTGTSNFSDQVMYFMMRGGLMYPQGGLLDDIAIWAGTALTATQVSNHYNMVVPGKGTARRRSYSAFRGVYTR